jgi:hypothetical protein
MKEVAGVSDASPHQGLEDTMDMVLDPLAIAALVGFVILLGITIGLFVWLMRKSRLPGPEK